MNQETSIIDLLQSKIAGGKIQLPVFNKTAMRIQRLLEKDDYDVSQVERVMIADQALVSDVLRFANSSFFGGLSKVSTPREAMVRLGAKATLNVIIAAAQEVQYTSRHASTNVYLRKLWTHALGCGVGARWLAEKLRHRSMAYECFLGGLLHDIGKLVVLKAIDDCKDAGEIKVEITEEMLKELLKELHAELGAMVLESWNLPEVYIKAAREHDTDEWDKDDTFLNIIRLSNLACVKIGLDISPDPSLSLVDTPEAEALRMDEIELAELEIVLEDQLQ